MQKISLSGVEAGKVADYYNLGKVKSFQYIKEGCVNYNFKFCTEKGDFIVRVLGRKGQKLQLEFRVLNYLKEKGFSYEIPNPVENLNGEYLSEINGKKLWVYKRIDGSHVKKINSVQVRQIAYALAEYHRIMKYFPVRLKEKPVNMFALKKRYAVMKKVKPHNEADRLMLDNLHLFEILLEQVKDFKFDKNVLLTHQDIHGSNVLFQGDRLTGILDFENLTMAPRINDIAFITKSLLFKKDELDRKAFNVFLKAYEEISPLSKIEKKAILPYLIKYNCYMFAEFYEHCFEGKVSDIGCLLWTINTAKGLRKAYK